MKLNNFRVRTRFFLLFAMILAALLLNGIWAFKTFHEYRVNGPLYEKIVENKDLIADVLPPPAFILEPYLVSLQMAHASDKNSLGPLVQRMAVLRKDFDERHAYWQKANLGPELGAVFLTQSHESALAFFKVVSDDLIPAVQQGDASRVNAAMARAQGFFDAHRKAIDQTVEQAARRVRGDETLVNELLANTAWITLGLLAVSTLMVAAMAWRFHDSIVTPVYSAVSLVTQIAGGELDHDIPVEGEDEFSQLHASLKEMQSSLREIVLSIRRGAEHLANASAEIAQGNVDLSRRTEQQAASLEEVASSMEELDSAVQQNATGARDANQLAQNASEIAARGGQVVSEVVRTMKGIDDSSKHIAAIISVIDSIAFQTNILALNAAVEAARAGEQGRGFAVVASEVRNLAGRTAKAAKEIEGLITSSVDQVGRGSVLVDQAGSTMTEVVAAIEQVTKIMREISAANSEQSSGVTQIDGSIMQIDRSTQENAALVEEMAASADTLSKQSTELVGIVAKFNTGKMAREPSSSRALATQTDAHKVAIGANAGIDVEALIDAHRQWKAKLTQAAQKQETVDVATLSRDDCCALGRWIYADGQAWSHQPAFTRLLKHHAEFHKVAGQVGELINQHNFDQARKELLPGSHFSKATISVVHDLAAIKQVLFG